jgi:hypothetical protein
LDWITIFGVVAVGAMVVFYALEARATAFTLAFALACLASSGYGFLAGAWPFGVVELIWSAVAIHRWRERLPR